MSARQRSKTGCWTCRLRRKKCSEGGPPCSNCAARGVFCHGYGPKPAWKDRGAMEQEEARKLLAQMSQHQGSLNGLRAAARTTHRRAQSLSTIVTPSSSLDDASPHPVSAALPDEQSRLNDFDFCLSLDPDRLLSYDTGTIPEDMTEAGPTALTARESCLSTSLSTWMADTNTTTSPSCDSDMMMSFTIPPAGQDLLSPRVVEGAFEQDGLETEREIHLLMRSIAEPLINHVHGQRAASEMMRMSSMLLLLQRSSAVRHASLSMSAYNSYLDPWSDDAASSESFSDYRKHKKWAIDLFHDLPELPISADHHKMAFPGERLICGLQLAILEVQLTLEYKR